MTGAPLVFVTGSTGYLGRHVLPAVLGAMPAATVRCLLLPGEELAAPGGAMPRVEAVHGSLTGDKARLAALLAGCTAVIHLAGYGLGRGQTTWEDACDVNVLGTFNLARASCAAGVGRFVMAQTALEYGPSSPGVLERRPLRETDPCFPEGYYGATKDAGARLARAACADAGVTFLGLRIFNTFGPAERSHKLVPANILASLRGEALPMTNGQAVRDYVFAGDVGRAFALAVSGNGLRGQQVVNIGSGTETTVAEMAHAVCALIPGAPGPRLGALRDRPGDPPYLVADVSAARAALGWAPSPDRNGQLRATIDWYRSRGGGG